jgi:hypothetical protein
MLNLTHRESRQHPQPMPPGEPQAIELPLNYIGQAIPAGHRLRLSLSTSYWPLAWPAPEPVKLDLHFEGSLLEIPLRADGDNPPIDTLGDPRGARPNRRELLEPERHEWIVRRNLATDRSVLEVIDDRGVHLHEATGLVVGTRAVERYSSCANDLSSVMGETEWRRSLARGNWNIHTETRTVLTSDEDDFHLQGDIDAFEDGDRVFCRTWRHSIPRDLV